MSFVKGEGFVAAEFKHGLFILQTVVTEDLFYEGIANDIIHLIQSLRKKNNLAMTDRISVWLSCPGKPYIAMRLHEQRIKEETQADRIDEFYQHNPQTRGFVGYKNDIPVGVSIFPLPQDLRFTVQEDQFIHELLEMEIQLRDGHCPNLGGGECTAASCKAATC